MCWKTFSCLSRQNMNGRPSWMGTGYVVDTNTSDRRIYPLYRFVHDHERAGAIRSVVHQFLRLTFDLEPPVHQFTDVNWSHLMDGVVDLTRARLRPQRLWMTNSIDYYNAIITNTEHQSVVFRLFSIARTELSAFTCSATPCRRRWRWSWACWKTPRSSAPKG